ncbi:hypothetical protein L6452_34429 [Arctium lappa]|uniref:Uncharacterized protein n=1 Tax=Arctium lappa TaxID=4217 RepID=A0ACB8YHJ0_ARCLA|nr:hypothetical protein L6452_34429 [Arctium lappa]
MTCFELADGRKYEGALGYWSAVGTTGGGGGSKEGEFGSVRLEWDSIGVRPEDIGERPELCSDIGPEGECGVRPDGSDDEPSVCMENSPDSVEEAVGIEDEESGRAVVVDEAPPAAVKRICVAEALVFWPSRDMVED